MEHSFSSGQNLSPRSFSLGNLFLAMGVYPHRPVAFCSIRAEKNWRLTLANWKWLAPAGILGFSGYSLLMFEAGHTTNATNMSLFGYMFWNRSVEHIGAARAGIVYYSIPLFSSIEAVFLLGETIQVSQMIGGTLIIGGILLSSLNVIKQIMRK